MNPRAPFAWFLILLGGVLVGLAVLPGVTASSWLYGATGTASLPLWLAAAWIGWFFAMWGSLVAIIIATGAWLVQPMPAAEETRLEAATQARSA
ncbi:MAG: hypothetical protein A3F84_04355 [Candidatus Handelsmanbacteria bacterium RIFCSPLOWO2_12_FULL_64_10]|uniref:Uncharacterized protein n=1 Tax=Handelsmanbacteria sp. (strain RIFCSPLOWO2_12_FULL_64_10) TaxID=1817868 RepID=A0A1F6D384_HANXR|nr:MAG: hypothetical protein A3F84_04355 [Candidatus Handelsmanbacteria bacterium RIFCSPLOWO2_12_FULL_64_10]